MAEPKFATDGKLGVDVYTVDTTQRHALGTTARSMSNNVLIYVTANEAITSASGVILGTSFTASAGTTGADLQSLYAIASGEFGWVENIDIQVT